MTANIEKKFNIAMLGHKRIPSREGGIEIVVEELALRLVRKGHSVTCYNRSRKSLNTILRKKGPRVKYYQGIRIKEVFTINRRGFAAMTSSIFGTVSAAFGRYDVVHFHAEGPSLFCWLPRLFHKRVIVTIHGLDWKRAKWGKLASIYIMAGERSAARFAHEIIVLSRDVQLYFQNKYGRKTVYVPNGVSKPHIKSAEIITERWKLEKNGYILFVGRIVPEKGLTYLLDAWKNIQTNKHLVIAGGSSDTEKYLLELKKRADERVLFTGFVDGEVLQELYSNAYIYVLPSDLEGMPLSLLEAMSYGNCCLISDIPECVEVVDDKAVIFVHSSTEDLQEKLQMLLTEINTVDKYKEQAAGYISRKYRWDDVAAKTIEVYRGCYQDGN